MENASNPNKKMLLKKCIKCAPLQKEVSGVQIRQSKHFHVVCFVQL